jgi:precorrin-6A/cobalt-precorrin-6A reductase
MTIAQIWLIGGTCESVELAIALFAQKLPYIVTVTTEAARHLYPAAVSVQVGKMTLPAMETFVRQQQIRCILDASHPFATQISREAIALSQRQFEPIAYLRYERPVISAHNKPQQSDFVITMCSLEELLASGILQHQRVLLTLGCRDLYRFSALRQTSQLFARILPSVDAIAQAQAAGFAPSELIALRPPVSAALEKALWQQWRISKVVAKASGHPGGEAIKRQVARELATELILLQRPTLHYPQQIHTVSEAVQFCAQILYSQGPKP